jgi:transposase
VTRAKLSENERVFECGSCGLRLDRDVNVSYNLEREGRRILALSGADQSGTTSTVARHTHETLNADTRRGNTRVDQSAEALSAIRAQPRSQEKSA